MRDTFKQPFAGLGFRRDAKRFHLRLPNSWYSRVPPSTVLAEEPVTSAEPVTRQSLIDPTGCLGMVLGDPRSYYPICFTYSHTRVPVVV
jgi:hypothetical protein